MTARDTKSPPKPVHAKLMSYDNQHLVLLAMAGPETPFRSEEPVHWFFRLPGEAWTLIEPGDALKRVDRHGCFARLELAELKLASTVKHIQFGVSPTADQPPSGPAADWVASATSAAEIIEVAVPDEPIFIHGNGGSGGEPPKPASRVEVSMSRTRVPNTSDEILWAVIRNSANSLGFDLYQQFMDGLFLQYKKPPPAARELRAELGAMMSLERFHYGSIDAYRVLKFATELFVKTHCGVVPDPEHPLQLDVAEEEARFGHLLPRKFEQLWEEEYLVKLGNPEAPRALILPYLDLIRRKLGDLGTVRASLLDQQAGLLQDKLVHPVLVELIWSYWMEEGMLVQGFNSIVRRFQNVRAHGERDPLAQLEIDALRPLNHLLWGWVQDEINQLSVLRRAHEYDHQYGFTLHGKAVAELRTADRRSKFLEAFHNLLWRCIQFYRQDDDTTVIADGFTVLNALKETHYLLAQGAHNQFGDLPVTARHEMLMQQWLLSRPEMREFLGGRVAVAYPEAWMDRVDALKTLKGWTSTSVVHFRDLAVFGEQILLSVRWGAWSTITDPASAANWARYWRSEIQGYVHAYRAATSVDLTAEITDQRQAEQRFLPPSVHLRRMLAHGAR